MRLFTRLLVLVVSIGVLSSVHAAHAAPDCSRRAFSLPDPDSPIGAPNIAIPIEHVLVLMVENHSFDNYFGHLKDSGHPGDPDGLTGKEFNSDRSRKPVYSHHMTDLCPTDVQHGWNASHQIFNGGKMDGFVVANDDGGKGDGSRAMGYYDETDIPYYYALARNFAIGDRFFASVLGPTHPNRFYLLTGTSFGHVDNTLPTALGQWDQLTIFEMMNRFGVDWKYYYTDVPFTAVFSGMFQKYADHMQAIAAYATDLALNRLPQVAFVESGFLTGDEHPPFNIQVGQRQVSEIAGALMKSKAWKSSALFLVWDEGGGFYDHVAPPEACAPDAIDPIPFASQPIEPGHFDRLGFRVPFLAISPYAKRGHVSHVTYDHTSILKFIETKFNLPALTRRDANADAMLDLFDFAHPQAQVPALPEAAIDLERLVKCKSAKPVIYDGP